MKRLFLGILFAAILSLPLYAKDDDTPMVYDDQYTIDTIITGIRGPGAPYVAENYAVFTAPKDARHVGISFDFEQYRQIHSLQELVTYDYNEEPVDSFLFYILELPENCTELHYRMIIDGLWTTDRLNPNKQYNYDYGTYLSVLTVNRPFTVKTQEKDPHLVTFVYEGESGKSIRLSGNFSNWDSFIYYLTETVPGRYEITLPLTSGTWYYQFYSGMTAMLDPKNTNRVYTPEGRAANIITVK